MKHRSNRLFALLIQELHRVSRGGLWLTGENEFLFSHQSNTEELLLFLFRELHPPEETRLSCEWWWELTLLIALFHDIIIICQLTACSPWVKISHLAFPHDDSSQTPSSTFTFFVFPLSFALPLTSHTANTAKGLNIHCHYFGDSW